MKVKLIKEPEIMENLTIDKIYDVTCEGFWGYTIANDIGKKVYIEEEYFEIVEK